MAGHGSKRMKSSKRHKIERKRREAKRDIRKAAKAMKGAGMATNRKKKAREAAKSALRLSKSSADKEQVLEKLLRFREMQKLKRQQKKLQAGSSEEEQSQQMKRSKRGREDEDDEEWEDEEEEDFDMDADEQPDEEFDDEEEEFDEEEEEEEDDGEDTAGPSGAAKQQAEIREQRRTFIPNNMASNCHETFRRYVDLCMFPQLDTPQVDTLPWEAPNFSIPTAVLFTLDARCAVQSCPWGELDYLMTLATESMDQQREMEQMLAEEKQRAAAAKKAEETAGKKKGGKKSGKKADDEPPVDNLQEMEVRAFVRPLVLFTLCKADTVAATTIAAQYKLLSDALTQKYGFEVNDDDEEEDEAAANNNKKPKRLLTRKEIPIEFAFAPASIEIEGCTRQIMRVLKDYGDSYHEAVKETLPSDKSMMSHNLTGRVAVLMHGLPKTGKSALLRSMCTVGESAVAVCPAKQLMMQGQNTDPTSAEQLAQEAEEGIEFAVELSTKIIYPSPKQINVVTLPDDQTFNRKTLIGGDAVFFSTMTLDRVEVPETVATLLMAQMPDLALVAQNFSCALPNFDGQDNGDMDPKQRAAMSILKSLGRSILREKGFLPSVYAGATNETTPGSFGTRTIIAASSVKDTQFRTVAGRRVVRVNTKKDDGKNVLRIGSRCFLNEFTSGKHFPWAVLTTADESLGLNNYRYPCIFTNKYFSRRDFGGEIPDDVVAELKGSSKAVTVATTDSKKQQAANAETFQSGLRAAQQAMLAWMVLLPKASIPVDPLSIVPQQYDYFATQGGDEDAEPREISLGSQDSEEQSDDEEEELDPNDLDMYLDDEAEEEEDDEFDEEDEFEEDEEGEWSDEE